MVKPSRRAREIYEANLKIFQTDGVKSPISTSPRFKVGGQRGPFENPDSHNNKDPPGKESPQIRKIL